MKTEMNKKEKMMEGKERIVWKDKRIIEMFLASIFLICFLFSIFGIFVSEGYYKIFFGILLLFSFYLIYLYVFRRKLTSVTLRGIIIGNLTFSKLNTYDYNQKQDIIKWDSIKSIFIKGMVHGSRSLAIDYLYVIQNTNKKLECRIYDPKGFILTLKKINRYHLLSNDSKYKL